MQGLLKLFTAKKYNFPRFVSLLMTNRSKVFGFLKKHVGKHEDANETLQATVELVTPLLEKTVILPTW